jgi:hypothetical protein
LRSLSRHAAWSLLLVAVMHAGLASLGLALTLMTGRSAAEASPGQPMAQAYGSLGVLVAIYAGLAWWAFSRPLPATVAAAAVFSIWLVVAALVDPRSLRGGLLVEALIAATLAQALIAAVRHQIRARR